MFHDCGVESHGPREVEADGEEPFVARPEASGIFEFRFLAPGGRAP